MSQNSIDPRLASFKSLTVKFSTLTRLTQPIFNEAQVSWLNKRTPANHIFERPGKGPGKPIWYYITAAYTIKSLNLLFGYNWSTDIKEFAIRDGQAVVLLQLTGTRYDEKLKKDVTITKTDFGGADIKISKGTSRPLSITNDLKAAVSDAIKRCYRQLGGALDVYASNEYVEILIADEQPKTQKDKKLKKITEKAKKDLVKQRKKELKDGRN